ncbi:MAG: Ig-like domain-containing protein [Lentisphaeraceae bacterium]|nr:Ig-like domain-containing protein [Lentisphaeraceae bacterium]
MNRFRNLLFLLVSLLFSVNTMAGINTFSVSGKNVYFNNKEFKVIGLRCSNALISEDETQELIDNLDVFKSYGVNTISVFVMGSRFGDIKGYNPDSSLNMTYANRLGRIIEEADKRGIIILVGCLYWSTSTAKADLGHWKQEDADKAVYNTVKWLKDNNYTNVFVDPDNEGMAAKATGWDIGSMIEAGHEANPNMVLGYNKSGTPPANADILLHHSPKDGSRPWIQSEGSPGSTPGGYWGSYSKEGGYYNYIRIGRYNDNMKNAQINQTDSDVKNQNGYMLASTYIQCAPVEGIGGPFMNPGGEANNPDINDSVKTLQSDIGILWWLKHVKNKYGAWNPESAPVSATFKEVNGLVSMEAESATQQEWTPSNDSSTSGGIKMINPGASTNDMTFKIKFAKTGKYYVWFRHAKPSYADGDNNDCIVTFDGKELKVGNGNSVIGMGTHQKSLKFESRPKSHHSEDRSYHPFFEVNSAGEYDFVVNSRSDLSAEYIVDKIVLIHADRGGNDSSPAVLGGLTSHGPDETRNTPAPPTNEAPTINFVTPANNSIIEEGASLYIKANASDSDGSINNVKLYVNGAFIRKENNAPYEWGSPSQSDAFLKNMAAGSYTLKVEAEDNQGKKSSKTISVTVKAESSFPGSLISDQVGDANADASYDDGVFTLSAAGSDIWNNSDEFGFVHQNWSGDLTIVAKVQSLTETHEWSKAGIMIRESLGESSAHVMLVVTPENGVSFQYRSVAGYKSYSKKVQGVTAPQWLKLVRTGNTFRSYFSTDGGSWMPLGKTEVDMFEDVKTGLVLTSHDSSKAATATFSGLELKDPQDELIIEKYVLVNADTDADVKEVYYNDTIDLNEYGNISLKVTLNDTPGSVVFKVNGSQVQIENNAGYFIQGNTGSDVDAWLIGAGTHTVETMPKSEKNGAGLSGETLKLKLNIVK